MEEGGNQIRFFFVSNSITLKRFMDLAMLHPYLGMDLGQEEVQVCRTGCSSQGALHELHVILFLCD